MLSEINGNSSCNRKQIGNPLRFHQRGEITSKFSFTKTKRIKIPFIISLKILPGLKHRNLF